MSFSLHEAVTETMSEEQLVAYARKGCEEAFSLLVSRCAPMIKGQAAAFKHSSLENEDLAQEGLMGLLSAVHSYNPDANTSFSTYANICIRRRMLSAIKRSAAAREIPASELVSFDDDNSESLVPEMSGGEDPAQLLVQKEDVFRLNRRLHEMLSKREYDVLMYYLNAYSYEEIAQKLGMRAKSVDNALQRIRRKLFSFSLSDT